nr:ARID DNA-binding domain-containing protein [Tanacetum cinerariifolium]
MVISKYFLDKKCSRPSSSAYGQSNMWHQSKPRRSLRKRLQYDFIQRKLRGEKEAQIGTCIRQRGHVIKNCPMKKQNEGIEKNGNRSETEKANNEVLMASKPSISIKYPESIYLETKCMLKGTDQGHWDDIWYVSNTNVHLCSKLSLFCNVREKFTANKLDDQMKFLFTYGLGEVVINNGDKDYLIPGVSYAPEVTLNTLSLELLERQGFEIMYEYNTCSLVYMFKDLKGVSYAPEVTLNILSLELLERQGFKIVYENNTCSLVYMFKDPKGQSFNEDKLRIMHNKHLEEYFESLDRSIEQNKPVGLVSMEDDVIEIKGTLYSTRVTTFNEYVGFLNLVKQDEFVSQEWDKFRNRVTTRNVEEGNGVNCLTSHQSEFAEIRTPHVEEGNGVNCFTSHQSDFAEIRTPNVEAAKRKEKMEHFGIELEDTSYESDNLSPIHPSIKER